MKILFIGNSHTYFNDMPALLLRIYAANKKPAEVAMLAHGGKGLDFHLAEKEARFNILYGGYDIVVLQHNAHPMRDIEVMRQSAIGMNELIQRVNAKTMLYMTWTERENEAGQPFMTDVYLKLGRDIGADVAPVGVAWWRFHHAHPEVELYNQDGKHASEAGSLLAAYTFFSALENKAAEAYDDIEKEMSKYAYEAVYSIK
jgi:hypothetical protein